MSKGFDFVGMVLLAGIIGGGLLHLLGIHL